MSDNVQNRLLKAALAGLVAGSVACGSADHAEKPAGDDHGEHAREKHDATPVSAAPAEQPAAGATHACKGQNECKGQGGCHVEGQNTCKGQNPCKGKGGCKTT